jgi:clathrin heavy chain
MSALPIQFREVLQLPALGINPQSISFATVTLEGDRYLSVRDQIGADKSVVIVDLQNPHNLVRRPTGAESTIMNPVHNILALRDAVNLQVFNLGDKQKVNDCTMSEAVEYWRWISESKIAIVTATSVYHWNVMESGAKPVKLFPRLQNLAGTQIISYRVDKAEKWCCLIGIAKAKDSDRIVGSMQLYSMERKQSQALEGHAAAFFTTTLDGATKPTTLFCFGSRTAASAKLFVIEVGTPSEVPFQKKQVDIYFPAEAAQDFPVAMQVSEKYGVLYMITKFGYIHIFHITTAKLVYMNRISADTIFATAPHTSTGGILGVNRSGQVLSVTLDENNIIPYIISQLNDYDLAMKMSAGSNLPGAVDLYVGNFNQLFQQGKYKEAAKVAADSPQGALRTTQTIQLFSRVPAVQGQPSPLLQYFSVLLEKGKLNKIESLELCRPVLQQGRKELLQNWLKEEKLDCSEELGDLVRQYDPTMALSIYYLADAKDKVVQCLADTGQFESIVVYAEKTGYTPDYMYILNGLIQTNPQAAASFAAKVLSTPSIASSINVNQVVDLFMQRNMVPETTSLLLDVLKNNKPEEGPLQTRLLEINLLHAPQVAAAIMGYEMLTHYNRPYIAQLCEKAGLYQQALEHYTNLADIKRVIVNTHLINPEFLVNYFGSLSVDDSLDCLREMMRVNPLNVKTVAAVATKYSDQLNPATLIKFFESFNSYEGLYLYLGSIVNFKEDPEVHFKYIEAAAKLGHIRDVERICRESHSFDPKRVYNFLKEAKLPDQLPLIIVSDRFDFVEDLTKYLYHNNMSHFIEAYVQKINPINTPAVVGALLDVDCNEDYVKNLVMSVRNLCPVDELVEQVEKRNRLKILLPWLEARVSEGNQEASTHNALAKIYIDMGRDPERFLLANQFYDSRVVGKYCEKRDPHLAYIAYKRGLCDDELIEMTNANSLFKNQARYLVERQSLELWAKVLTPSNEYMKQVVDKVIDTALPESKVPEEVSVTVKAFMAADLPHYLIDLLERLVFEHSEFKNNKNLQNLLILTAIKVKQEKVMEYVNRLNNYDPIDIANIAVGEGLFEEGFATFKKWGYNDKAMEVLLGNIQDLERAVEFAESCSDPKVHSLLAQAQLANNLVKEAIGSYLKANDPENYVNVIVAAEREQLWEDLVSFLHMCRKKVKEAHIESEIIYALAKVNKLAELEEFISGPNCAQIQLIGDRCFDEGMYEAAKLLFNNISNYARLATTLVKLQQYSSAVEAARKANSTKTWREVNLHLVDAKEFRLAQICALHLIIHGDELEELIRQYESRGYFDEVISVLESGLALERAHVGMFTELAILYSKYRPEKLEEHLKLFHSRINIPKVLRVCQQNDQWRELTFLYKSCEEWDNAAMTMITHPVEAWEHSDFKSVIVKVTAADIFNKAVRFYLQEHPTMVNDLLNTLSKKVEHAKVVGIARELGLVALIKPYLVAVQSENIKAVNEALNELYVEEEDYEALARSIEAFTNFDDVVLAKKLHKHELVEFRRIAARLYKKNGQWQVSVELSKEDGLFKDAMQTAADSGDPAVVEGLLRYFVEKGSKECFAACLYTCYDLVKPDVALELAWRNGFMDFVMPYMIQVLKEYSTKVEELYADKLKKEKAKEDEAASPPQLVTGAGPAVFTVVGQDPYGVPVGMPMAVPVTMPMTSAIPQIGLTAAPPHPSILGASPMGLTAPPSAPLPILSHGPGPLTPPASSGSSTFAPAFPRPPHSGH